MSEEQSNRELALFELKQAVKGLFLIWALVSIASILGLLLFERKDIVIFLLCGQLIILPYTAWQTWHQIKDIYYNKPGHLYDKPPTQQ